MDTEGERKIRRMSHPKQPRCRRKLTVTGNRMALSAFLFQNVTPMFWMNHMPSQNTTVDGATYDVLLLSLVSVAATALSKSFPKFLPEIAISSSWSCTIASFLASAAAAEPAWWPMSGSFSMEISSRSTRWSECTRARADSIMSVEAPIIALVSGRSNAEVSDRTHWVRLTATDDPKGEGRKP